MGGIVDAAVWVSYCWHPCRVRFCVRYYMEGRIMGGYKKKKVLDVANRYVSAPQEWRAYHRDMGALLK